MSDTPVAKRRRLNEVGIHKPFKSPLRRDPLTPRSSNSPNVQTPTQSLHHKPTAQTPTITFTQSDDQLRPKQPRLHARVNGRLSKSSPLRHSTSPLKLPTPSELYERSQTRALESALRDARKDIDTLTQAISILRNVQKHAELPALIDKWRDAARGAAEEMYAQAREKVNRMGGVGAWRDREREGIERRVQWEREETEFIREKELEKMRESEGWDEREVEGLSHGKDVEREGDGDAVDVREDDGPKEEENDGFTIGMMLKSAGIDFDVIGYDPWRKSWTVVDDNEDED